MSRNSMTACLVGRVACMVLLLAIAHAARDPAEESEYFFFNTLTGKSQWEDPGDVPWVDENGNKFWKSENGEWINQDRNAWRYVWIERWSEEHKRPYFFNQDTKQSTWTRPADLAWQRVHVTDATRSLAPKRPGGGPTPSASASASASAFPLGKFGFLSSQTATTTAATDADAATGTAATTTGASHRSASLPLDSASNGLLAGKATA